MNDAQRLLLDTNVISELVRESPSTAVTRWLSQRDPESLYISVISLGEIADGITRLSDGARRRKLERWLETELSSQFGDRVLDFGRSQAIAWGKMKAATEKKGRPRGAIDLQLAATAHVADLTLATRNVRDFEGLGVPLIDPWE